MLLKPFLYSGHAKSNDRHAVLPRSHSVSGPTAVTTKYRDVPAATIILFQQY